jgi:heat shock protein HslJ
LKVNCAICNRFMGEVTIEGRLRTGYAALSVYVECSDCYISEGNSEARAVGDDAMEKLMGLFGLKK